MTEGIRCPVRPLLTFIGIASLIPLDNCWQSQLDLSIFFLEDPTDTAIEARGSSKNLGLKQVMLVESLPLSAPSAAQIAES